MSVSISGEGSVTGIDQGLNVVGVLTASGGFSGNLTGNVTGTVNSSGIATFTSGIVVSAGSTSAPSISPSGDSNTGIFFPSADTIAFGEGGVESARFDSNGRLGIGTVSPSTTLDVGGTIRNTPDKSSYIQVGRFSAAYGGAALSTAGGSTFLSLQVEGFEGIKLDSAGRMTLPYQPACDVYGTGTCTVTDGTTQTLGLSAFQYNRGFSITSNKLVIPKTGYYSFTTGYISQISGSGYSIRAIRIFPRINGTVLAYPDARWNSAPAAFSNTHYEIKHSWVLNLVENDQIDLQVAIYHNRGSALSETYHTYIHISLLG